MYPRVWLGRLVELGVGVAYWQLESGHFFLQFFVLLVSLAEISEGHSTVNSRSIWTRIFLTI